MAFEALSRAAQFSNTTGGYMTGEKDPYRALRQQAAQTVQAAQLNPYETPTYQYAAPKIEQGLKAGAAGAGIADSLLTNEQIQEAKSSLAAQIYQNLFANRLGAISTAAGIPYLRDYASSAAGFGGFGGGGGGGGVNLDFSRVDADRAYRLAQQAQKAGANRETMARQAAAVSYFNQPTAGGAAQIAPTQTQIVSPTGGISTYYGGGAPMTETGSDFY